jgi:pre-mRNA-splicing factor RBM22/SLT11
MTNVGIDKECKVCARPFTVFRWSPGPNMRFRHTIICQTCSKIRNCCQSCALDLTFAIPVGIRDSVLETTTVIPKTDMHRQYYVEKMDHKIKSSSFEEDQLAKSDTIVKEYIKKVAAKAYSPYDHVEADKTSRENQNGMIIFCFIHMMVGILISGPI